MLSSRGSYQISGKQITFFRKDGKPEALELFRYGGQEYLGTREEQRDLRKDPKGQAEHLTLKRSR